MGLNISDRGHAMVAVDFSKREVALWRNRGYFREAMESPLSNSGDLLFSYWPGYTPGTMAGQTCPAGSTVCTTNNRALNGGGGSVNVFNNAWAGNFPTQAAINAVFADRSCAPNNCITPGNAQGGYFFNADGTLFTRQSSFTLPGASLATPVWSAGLHRPVGWHSGCAQRDHLQLHGEYAECLPRASRRAACRSSTGWITTVDSRARARVTLFANADFKINDRVTAYSSINFASSKRRPAASRRRRVGAFAVAIPYHSDPNAKYLPSVVQVPQPGIAVGDTLPEYRVGGKRGTNCAPTGGCTMAQAFPVSSELRTLLNSRPDVVLGAVGGAPTAASPFNGMSVCELRMVDVNTGLPGHTSQVAAANGRPAYSVAMDPNTGETFKICGPNSSWRMQNQLTYLPPRGTFNNQTTWQLVTGLTGDTGLSDWTYDLSLSQGDSRTNTEYVGYISSVNYNKILTAPNYGQGYREESQGVSNKVLNCTSGLNPFAQAAGTLNVTQDCVEAITSNQTDRQMMKQFESQLNLQGGLFALPAGEVRAAFGLSWRKNTYTFIPDSLRESDYTADTSAGQFGVGFVDGSVAVKEAYSELLIPLLRDLPGIRSLELELGGRYSQYTTGQDVPTYKAQLSWEPLSWLRVRGGYNRAERTPNIAELYTSTTVSSQLTGVGTDPCATNVAATLPQSNNPNNPDRAKLQALCSAQINFWGSSNSSTFHADPNNFTPLGGVLTFEGNPNLKSEQGDTYTAGIVFRHRSSIRSRRASRRRWTGTASRSPIQSMCSAGSSS